jgi:hypothetical protein
LQTLQNLVDSLSRRLRCAVSLDDRPLQMMFHSCVYGQLDEARIRRMLAPDRGAEPEVLKYIHDCVRPAAPVRSPLRIPPNPRIGVQARMYMPIRLGEESLGTILVFDPEYSVGESDIPAIVSAASIAAQIIRYELVLWDPDRSREHDLLAAILYGDAETSERAGREVRRLGLLEPGPMAVLAVARSSPFEAISQRVELTETAEELRASLTPGYAVVAERDGEVHVLLSMSEPAVRQDGLPALATHLGRLLPAGLGLGFSEPCNDFAGASKALTEARQALRLAGHEPFGTTVGWSDLGAFRLLLQLPESTSEGNFPLVEAVEEIFVAQPTLYQTLDCYLRHAGHSQDVARELFIHRATLHYRLRRIEELTCCSLDSGEDRLALHLALKLAFLRRYAIA